MAGKRERIAIRRIDNLAARQVTFSKRRRGLFKKAEELSILCDAEVGLVVFSATGKLFHFASTSMKQVIDRYDSHSKNLQKSEAPSQLQSHIDDGTCARLKQELAETSLKLRQMRGEELQRLSVQQLQELEKTLESGLGSVLKTKSQKILDEISGLERKRMELIEENSRLKEQVNPCSPLLSFRFCPSFVSNDVSVLKPRRSEAAGDPDGKDGDAAWRRFRNCV
ncbi:hypothetical protein BDA96_01G510000 [Sorghum bicolor]|uniref:Uncharacterized protein n=2 Tax=Sorghum bicolor TaxID=4558 RepID=A0A921S6C3_SORBI|nr:hypothetical protein BDA96_01G510000 [Sorghum bicolor]KXG40018.1 hypothetical protein SORBI_3001G478400 [Sorghum bicolor]